MLTSIEEKTLRRILHRLRSDAHIAEAFSQSHRRKEDPVASAYHQGEAAGIMQAVALLEQNAMVPKPAPAQESAEGAR